MLEFGSHASLRDACDSLLFHISIVLSEDISSVLSLYSLSVCTLPQLYLNIENRNKNKRRKMIGVGDSL